MSMHYNDPFLKTNAKDMQIKASHSWYRMVASCFYIGEIPFAKGTFGSLAAYPIYYWALHHYSTHDDLISFLYGAGIILSLLGWYAICLFQRETKAYDHGSIVIDELVGQLLTLAATHHWLFYLGERYVVWHKLSLGNFSFLVSFIAFRWFDITKPLIIGYVDDLHRYSFAVMLDDILAAAFASGTIYICYMISLRLI